MRNTVLSSSLRYLQSKGILCLADEVQTGFGRSGTHFWAFQSYEEGDEHRCDFVRTHHRSI